MSIRPVYFVSDGTGITAETIGNSLLTQFGDQAFECQRLSFIDSLERARQIAATIRADGESRGVQPIVINTIVDGEMTRELAASGALVLDVFEPFLERLEQALGQRRQPRVGRAHAMVDPEAYERRMEATNFALTHDDGVDLDYDEADVLLVGVSRSGKTPTCLYLALHHSLRAANYPLTPDDLDADRLPEKLRRHRRKLFGLTIDPSRLQKIREERKPGSRYATLEVCKREVAIAEAMFHREQIPVLSTTHTSIEEIASKIVARIGLRRPSYF
ncbi:pyruvate, water dikinase regulatory protein [Silanimonas sp.]|uniref:posphoenolpyruvate synthetase regulatory kinase/phosphorylase PpsR n=1 Tax=Silanimonas sp. TaxID=1929290 RepID=UPI001BC622F8|nr:pyruvate, water dikinase regulatory protein [Silanimonas sp.]MBS3896111.1 kinase/pyrophosphorylase [Silanimonas sp.]MBS3923839.1 kinase/pyrophosphorylase [Xanthomonadaceae bacterium]